MDVELLKWMASCPIAEGYRAHPDLVAEIEECGLCVALKAGEMVSVPAGTSIDEFFKISKTLGGKPLSMDTKTNPHTLQVLAKGHMTPVLAIELKRGV